MQQVRASREEEGGRGEEGEGRARGIFHATTHRPHRGTSYALYVYRGVSLYALYTYRGIYYATHRGIFYATSTGACDIKRGHFAQGHISCFTVGLNSLWSLISRLDFHWLELYCGLVNLTSWKSLPSGAEFRFSVSYFQFPILDYHFCHKSRLSILVTYTSWNITSVLISCQFLILNNLTMLIITSVLIRVNIFCFEFWSPWCLEYHFCLDQRVNFQCHSPGRGPSLFFWPRNEKFCHFIIRKSYFVIQFQLLEIENHEDGWKGVNYREIAERWF